MNIVFIVDTSPSMCQRAFSDGKVLSFLDIAKQTVEMFLALRRTNNENQNDSYILMTFEDPPKNVKSAWKEELVTFKRELNNLRCTARRSMGDAIKHALEYVNGHRLCSGIELISVARNPRHVLPTTFIVLSNGKWDKVRISKFIHSSGDATAKTLFHWDQHIYYFVLRIPGHFAERKWYGYESHKIDKTCRFIVGRTFIIRSGKQLKQCIAHVNAQIACGVWLDIQTENDPRLEECFMHVPNLGVSESSSHDCWPIPASYWVDMNWTQLPPRDTRPKLRVVREPSEEPTMLTGFPVDRYPLKKCRLIKIFLLKTVKNHGIYPIYAVTGKSDEKPFGYLKPNKETKTMELIILPYNYPELFPLLSDLIDKHHSNPPQEWKCQFRNYVDTVPTYYDKLLKGLLSNFFQMTPELVKELLPGRGALPMAIIKHLETTFSNGLKEQEWLLLQLQIHLTLPKPAFHEVTKVPCQPLSSRLNEESMDLCDDVSSESRVVVPMDPSNISILHPYNPYNIPRRNLLDVLAKLKEQFYWASNGYTQHKSQASQDVEPLRTINQQHLNEMMVYLPRKKIPFPYSNDGDEDYGDDTVVEPQL